MLRLKDNLSLRRKSSKLKAEVAELVLKKDELESQVKSLKDEQMDLDSKVKQLKVQRKLEELQLKGIMDTKFKKFTEVQGFFKSEIKLEFILLFNKCLEKGWTPKDFEEKFCYTQSEVRRAIHKMKNNIVDMIVTDKNRGKYPMNELLRFAGHLANVIENYMLSVAYPNTAPCLVNMLDNCNEVKEAENSYNAIKILEKLIKEVVEEYNFQETDKS